MKQRFRSVKPHLRPEGNGSASFFPLTPRWFSQDTVSGIFHILRPFFTMRLTYNMAKIFIINIEMAL
jgi:hypothetical protein